MLPITEDSAIPGSSGFLSVSRSIMDPAIRLVCLHQRMRSLKDHIEDFGHCISLWLPDFALTDFFCHGLNEPLKSILIRDGPQGLLCQFLDYALLLCGSSFTVGTVEENVSPKNFFLVVGGWLEIPKMTASPEPPAVMDVMWQSSALMTKDIWGWFPVWWTHCWFQPEQKASQGLLPYPQCSL